MTAATDPNSCEEPQEVAHASARLVHYELIWCNHDSQTVHDNDFLGKSSHRDTLRGGHSDHPTMSSRPIRGRPAPHPQINNALTQIRVILRFFTSPWKGRQ